MTEPADWPVVDLRAVLELGLERGGHLLTQGELHVVRTMLGLPMPAARLHARLLDRRPDVFHVPGLKCPGVADIDAAATVLVRAGLADHLVPWAARARHVTRPLLVDAARQLGLPHGGRKAELVERVAPHRGWLDGRWIRLRHTQLVLHLQQWAMLRVFSDRRTFVVERLGHARWPSYQPTSGVGLWRRRDDWRHWSRLAVGDMTTDETLDALDRQEHRGPGLLDLRRRLVRRLLDHARTLERQGDPGEALRIYERLEAGAHVPPSSLAFRGARAHEALGDSSGALALLVAARAAARPRDQLAISRAGRRLARAAGCSWPPDRPLRTARSRIVELPTGESGARPTWRVDGRDYTVEDAVIARLEAAGRQAVRAEGPLWATLSALLLVDTWFLDVPGVLPMPRLSAPLDLGTPAFVEARREAVDAVLKDIRGGGASERLGRAWKERHLERLRGVRWRRWSPSILEAIVASFPPVALATIIETLATSGPRGCRGLPDLVLLPGPPGPLSGFWPTRLPGTLAMIEVKGPGDSLRDGQRVWVDRLARAGTRVEVWTIRPSQTRPGHAQPGMVGRAGR